MSIIQPNGKIWLCKNVPLNPSMTDTLYFTSESDRYNYFLNHSDISFTNVSYVRVQDGTIRLQVNPETVYNYNYMMFTNTGFSNRYFFAFITSVRYINNVTAELDFEIDPMITWFFDYHLQECYVEREHSSTDNIGDNIIPEGLDYNNYIVTGESSYMLNGNSDGSYVLMLVSGLIDSSGTPVDPIPGVYAGTYCGLMALTFDLSTQRAQLTDFILRYYGTNPDMIIAMFSIPYRLYEGCVADNSYHLYGAVDLDLNYTLNGYTPKNNKLYTYPYNKCTLTDEHGTEIDLAFEYFDNPTEATFSINGVLIPSPEIMCAPMHYQGMINEYNYAISFKDFPKLAWSTDYYKEWYNQNVSKINASLTSNAINTVSTAVSSALTSGIAGSVIGGPTGTVIGAIGGAISGAVGAATSTVKEISNIEAQISTAMKVSNVTHGTYDSSNICVAVQELWQFGIFQKCFPSSILRSIDDYFSMFGYATKRVKTPNTWVRQRWTYTKTQGCQITGEIPAQDMEQICKIYDNGIRFWKGNSDGSDVVGQFNLSNNVL